MIKHAHLLVAFVVVLALSLGPTGNAADSPALRVGVSPVTAPMVYKEGGKVVGIEADFAAALGQALGRSVTFVEVAWENQIEALVEGRTDIIMSCMSMTRARQLRVAFTKPYMAIGQMPLIRRADASQYVLGFPSRPKGVAGVWKATTGDYMMQQEFPGTKRKEFKNPEAAVKALLKKQIDLFICDSPIVWWQAGLNEAEGLYALPVLLSDELLAWAVRKSDTALLDSVNSTLDTLQKSGQATAIIKRHIPLYK